MLNIIETPSQLEAFKLEEDFEQCYVDFIQTNENKHPNLDSLTALYIYSFKQEQGFLINFTHPDALKLDILNFDFLNEYKDILVYDKKYAMHMFDYLPYTDLQSIYYANTGKTHTLDSKPLIYSHFYRKFPSTQTNKIIPLGKLYEWCEIKRINALQITEKYSPSDTTEWYNRVLIPTLYNVEKQGIPTHEIQEVFDINSELSLKSGLFFSLYNYQTTTGRPSNKFNNVNFMALQKESQQRKCIVPQNDYILEIDYDGYHPRIIGDIVGFEFDAGTSVHEQLGKMYFKTEELSKEQYAKSKELTFKQLYGGVFEEFAHLPFFDKTIDFIVSLYYRFNEEGYISLPISKRRFYKDNYNEIGPQKLFNYFIQMSETERNMEIMYKLNEFLENKNTKLIMYMYDAFIFDVDERDGKNIKNELDLIIRNNKFRTKAKQGNSFGELIEIDLN